MKKGLVILLDIVLIGGGIYWLVQYNNASHAPATQLTRPNETPFAVIDTLAVSAGSPSQDIKGTCGNVPGEMAITIVRGKIQLPSYTLPEYPNSTIFTDYTDHDGQFFASCKSAEGTFTTRYTDLALEAGAYTVGIYAFKSAFTSEGYRGNAQLQLLTSSTLTVK